MTWTPYRGESYLDSEGVDAFCHALADAHPEWVALERVGASRQGRAILLLTLGDRSLDPAARPAFWLDGGTHAAEWTGVMATLYSVTKWVEALIAGDPAARRWFSEHTVYCLPNISPDGMQALHDGAPFLRSCLRPPKPGTVISGFEPRDIDGDGAVRWMRWRDPAGPFVSDPDLPLYMRPRTLDDDPADCWFQCSEGDLLNWDGVRWTSAPRRYGMDLNRNYPEAWRPFSMFGMDGGAYTLSEPESRAVVDAFAKRSTIAAALTNHTYTGALLTAPARAGDVLSSADVRLLERLADEAVVGTDYRVIKKHPDFVYDAGNPIAGCWDDCLTNTFGVAGYTLELWDPFRHAGVDNPRPADFFRKPDPARVRALFEKFGEDPGAVRPWTPFEHPQLGPVEIGGLDYLRTIRNPPLEHLAAECERGFLVADRLRRAIPTVRPTVDVWPVDGEVSRVRLTLENTGYLGTESLAFAETIGAVGPASATLEPGDGVDQVDEQPQRPLEQLGGWGGLLVGLLANPLYASLPGRGHRTTCTWLLRGGGTGTIDWHVGRGGHGTTAFEV